MAPISYGNRASLTKLFHDATTFVSTPVGLFFLLLFVVKFCSLFFLLLFLSLL